MTKTVNTIISGVEFSTTSARNARTPKQDDLALAKKLTDIFNNYNDSKKDNEQLKGFCIGFNIDGNIYAACFPLADCLARVKSNKGCNKILQPIGKQQVLSLCEYICSYEELEAYKSRMRGTDSKNNGIAFQKYLASLGHQKANLTTPLSKGGDLYKNKNGYWEVKYMSLGTSQGSSRL